MPKRTPPDFDPDPAIAGREPSAESGELLRNGPLGRAPGGYFPKAGPRGPDDFIPGQRGPGHP